MLGRNRDFESIEKSIDAFQKNIEGGISVPVVVATSGLALGKSCELGTRMPFKHTTKHDMYSQVEEQKKRF